MRAHADSGLTKAGVFLRRNAPKGARLASPAAPSIPPARTAAPRTPQTPQAAAPARQPAAAAGTRRADPAAVAQECLAAGHPELIVALLKSGASLDTVRERLASAGSDVADIGAKLGMPALGTKLAAAGVSLEAAREILFDAKAAADAGHRIDTAHGIRPNPAARTSGLDAVAVYAAFNAPQTVA